MRYQLAGIRPRTIHLEHAGEVFKSSRPPTPFHTSPLHAAGNLASSMQPATMVFEASQEVSSVDKPLSSLY